MCATLLLAGCFRSSLGEVSAGYARAWSGEDDSFAARVAVGAGDYDGGSGLQVAVRTGEDSAELALGLHFYRILFDENHVGIFLRGGFDLIEWDRVGSDDSIGGLGPSLHAGVIVAGACVVASVSRDLRLSHADDTFVGISVGRCKIQRRGW